MFLLKLMNPASICLVHVPINVLGWMGWDALDGWDGNHVETTWKPCGAHVETTWKPCGDMCKPCANHVQTIWKPHENHVGDMWKPHENHVGDMCKPCANHMKTMWGTCANHVQTMWKPHENHVGRQCPAGPKSQIPRPNQGFQMKFGRLANTWSSKNATCRGTLFVTEMYFSSAWFAFFCLKSCKSCQYLLSSCTN